MKLTAAHTASPSICYQSPTLIVVVIPGTSVVRVAIIVVLIIISIISVVVAVAVTLPFARGPASNARDSARTRTPSHDRVPSHGRAPSHDLVYLENLLPHLPLPFGLS